MINSNNIMNNMNSKVSSNTLERLNSKATGGLSWFPSIRKQTPFENFEKDVFAFLDTTIDENLDIIKFIKTYADLVGRARNGSDIPEDWMELLTDFYSDSATLLKSKNINNTACSVNTNSVLSSDEKSFDDDVLAFLDTTIDENLDIIKFIKTYTDLVGRVEKQSNTYEDYMVLLVDFHDDFAKKLNSKETNDSSQEPSNGKDYQSVFTFNPKGNPLDFSFFDADDRVSEREITKDEDSQSVYTFNQNSKSYDIPFANNKMPECELKIFSQQDNRSDAN